MEIDIKIFINQMGNLKIKWEIPKMLILGVKETKIQLPSFKFDLPKVAGIPVPLSSKAIKIEISNIRIENDENHIKHELIEDFEGNNILRIITTNLNEKIDSEVIILTYEIDNIVNNDTIYYAVVYPLINPFKNVKFNIELKARFSYKIRAYKFKERYFNSITGKQLFLKKSCNTTKEGDLITVNSKQIVLKENVEFDIHLTGSRLPYILRRDVFWLIIFAISLGIILSPIWSELICK